MARVVSMQLLIDENVPDSVVSFFRSRGHVVSHVRECFLDRTPDAIIAAIADKKQWILVTWDRDFKRLADRVPRGGKAALRRMGRISFACNESRGLLRANQCIESIEFEYQRRLSLRDQRLIVQITETTFTVVG